LWGPEEKRNSPKSIVLLGKSDGKSLAWLPSLKRLLKVQFVIPYEKFQQSRFKRAYVIGAPGWLSQLSIQLLILAQVMISGS